LALRNLQQQANQKGTTITLSFERLNKLMRSSGIEQFSYDPFKAAYDSDPRVKALVKNFDQKGVTLATDEESNLPQQDAKGDNTVSNMAKRATDLG
jgi:hypothetical protein